VAVPLLIASISMMPGIALLPTAVIDVPVPMSMMASDVMVVPLLRTLTATPAKLIATLCARR
jgi:hypothetical protein